MTDEQNGTGGADERTLQAMQDAARMAARRATVHVLRGLRDTARDLGDAELVDALTDGLNVLEGLDALGVSMDAPADDARDPIGD